MIVLGERIKELRQRGGRTQEALAVELGVTAQAVSRWEKGACCPDIELIPSIANYFGVSIDELFGYDNERSRKVDSLFSRITEMNRMNNGEDVCMDDCIALAREALIEFPGNVKLSLALASALFNAGYVRRGELHKEDREGYSVYDAETHRTYPEWQESVKLYEKVLPELADGSLRRQAVTELSQLYKNLGEHEKAMGLAEASPDIEASKPFLMINAFDGKEAVAACGEALIETLRRSAELMVRIVISDRNMPPHIAAGSLKNAADMFDQVFADGCYGSLNGLIACIYMLRSYYLWLAGEKDEAFISLENAYKRAEALDELSKAEDEYYTAPLLKHVKQHTGSLKGDLASELPELWPWWDVPERDVVKAEMEKDPRWEDLSKRAK